MKGNIFISAYAKVNLQLDVLGKRPDGYHELAGIMQLVSLHDDMIVSASFDPRLSSPLINVNFSEPVPDNNTVRKAARLFMGSAPYRVDISVKKYIPSEAGLGGASADAAGTLRGLNALFTGTELEKSEAELYSMAAEIGADVPFCLHGGCCVSKGIGEVLTPLSLPEPPLELIIIKGERGISTPGLFGLFDELFGTHNTSRLAEGALQNAADAIACRDIASLGKYMLNALQPAAEQYAPEIAEETALLYYLGAVGACMTGSGSAVIGLFDGETAVQRAIGHLEAVRPKGLFYTRCRTMGPLNDTAYVSGGNQQGEL